MPQFEVEEMQHRSQKLTVDAMAIMVQRLETALLCSVLMVLADRKKVRERTKNRWIGWMDGRMVR